MTSSPGLFLRTSTGLVSSACTVLPDCNWLALAACALPCLPETFACEAAPAEPVELACAPDLSPEAEVFCDADPPACTSAGLWAIQTGGSKTVSRNKTMVLFTRTSENCHLFERQIIGEEPIRASER